MADIVGSAVIEGTVSSIISSLSRKAEEKVDINETIEKLEIAQIKMEFALDMSNKWQISSMPLLRWRRKLKRAAQECDNTLRRCKQRAIEEEDIRQQASRPSFPCRIVHATKSFMSSFIHFGKDDSIDFSTNTRRFERFADGASDFLKFVEFGGTPRQYSFFNPLIGHLLTGKGLRYQVLEGSRFSYFGIRPMNFAERGVEALIGFISIDFRDPLKGLNLSFILRLSDSTDIFGVMIKCMQSVTPHFKFATEHARELSRLPTHDFSIVPHYSTYVQSEYWVNVHNIMTQWCRPNPLCCNEHDLTPYSSKNSTTGSLTLSSTLLSNIFPEEVIMVLLQCHIFLPNQRNRQNSVASTYIGGETSLNMHPLKLGALFLPHDSPEDIGPAVESYALEVVDEKEDEIIHWNACLKDLDEKLLPKAMDYLYRSAESKMYQMCLKMRHGTAHLCVEKMSTQMQSSRRGKATRRAHKRRVYMQDKRSEQWNKVARDLLKLWVVRASDKLEGSIRSWTAVQNMP